MTKPIISVRNISKVYRLGEIGVTSVREESARAWRKFRGKEPLNDEGDFWALNDVSFDVEQGEVVGIIGKNGAGKSTLLKILSRITEPSGGEVRLRGRVAALLEVGTGFHPELTGRENIYLNGTILGMKKREIDAKLDEIIAFSGIEKHIDTPVKRYSSGMNVRLGFAVAAHLEPEILIVDEVLAVGDADFQKKCIEKMQDVASKGRTVLFVSHNMSSVARLTDRCIVIDKGSVAKSGPTREAIDFYLYNGQVKMPADGDISKYPRLPYGDGSVTALKLQYLNEDRILRLGDDLKLCISLQAKRNIDDLQLQMTIFSANGTTVGTACSQKYIQIRKDEVVDISMSLPDPSLSPGKYFSDLALVFGKRLEAKTALEVLPRVIAFEVSSMLSDKTQLVHWNDAWGRVILPEIKIQDQSN